MKIFINDNKVFNLKKAKKIDNIYTGSSDNGTRIEESLYHCANGEFILYYNAEHNSKYKVEVEPEMFMGSEGIIEISKIDALNWIIKYVYDAEKYLGMFPDLIQMNDDNES